MQAKECHDGNVMKPLDSDDRMELLQTRNAKNQEVVESGSGSESNAMDISPRKPLSSQDTDHNAFRGGAPSLPGITPEWIKYSSMLNRFRHCCTSYTCFPLLKSRERAVAKRYAVVDNIIQTLKFEDWVAPSTDLRGVPEPSHYGDLVFVKKKKDFRPT